MLMRWGKDVYNTYGLAGADGRLQMHDKDQPTMWENGSYIAGSDDGVIETECGAAGVAVCWQLGRWRTSRRFAWRGRGDIEVGDATTRQTIERGSTLGAITVGREFDAKKYLGRESRHFTYPDWSPNVIGLASGLWAGRCSVLASRASLPAAGRQHETFKQ